MDLWGSTIGINLHLWQQYIHVCLMIIWEKYWVKLILHQTEKQWYFLWHSIWCLIWYFLVQWYPYVPDTSTNPQVPAPGPRADWERVMDQRYISRQDCMPHIPGWMVCNNMVLELFQHCFVDTNANMCSAWFNQQPIALVSKKHQKVALKIATYSNPRPIFKPCRAARLYAAMGNMAKGLRRLVCACLGTSATAGARLVRVL